MPPSRNMSQSGEHELPCDEHSVRLQMLEQKQQVQSERITKSETALIDGRVLHAEMRKDMQAMALAIEHLTEKMVLVIDSNRPNYVGKAVEAAIFWLVPIAGYAAFWLLQHSNALVRP